MMTFKELKKLVKLPLYKEQRVPTVKALEESGVSVVAEKILENHGSISVYQNGYVIYRAHKRVTVFSLRNCVHYKCRQSLNCCISTSAKATRRRSVFTNHSRPIRL